VLTPYTTSDQVRAVLGVTEDELPDETLDLPLYEAGLRQELAAVGASVAVDYVTASAEATPPAVDQAFVDAVTLFAPTAVAAQLAQSFPLFAPKDITDGKASVGRFVDSPFQTAIDACRRNYEKYRQALERAYAAYKNTTAPVITTTPDVFVVASPSSDPVAGT
jgi:hypothetical protein